MRARGLARRPSALRCRAAGCPGRYRRLDPDLHAPVQHDRHGHDIRHLPGLSQVDTRHSVKAPRGRTKRRLCVGREASARRISWGRIRATSCTTPRLTPMRRMTASPRPCSGGSGASPLTQSGQGGSGQAFPRVNMVLASHNAETVRKARAILDSGVRGTEIAFCAAAGHGRRGQLRPDLSPAGWGEGQSATMPGLGLAGRVKPRAYKYLVWGSTGECMKYLLRRAQENRDAVQRTRSGRDAMRAEVWRRMKALFGLA